MVLSCYWVTMSVCDVPCSSEVKGALEGEISRTFTVNVIHKCRFKWVTTNITNKQWRGYTAQMCDVPSSGFHHKVRHPCGRALARHRCLVIQDKELVLTNLSHKVKVLLQTQKLVKQPPTLTVHLLLDDISSYLSFVNAIEAISWCGCREKETSAGKQQEFPKKHTDESHTRKGPVRSLICFNKLIIVNVQIK